MAAKKNGANPNQVAAHELLSELRTRITTQPLPYQYGVESRALESLFEVFSQAREAMKRNPGCEEFAQIVTHMLNVDLRPVTAKWHRAFEEGRLESRDGGDEFRGDLREVQQKLSNFSASLRKMAYGVYAADIRTQPVINNKELETVFTTLPFGIPDDWLKGPIEREPACKWMSKIRGLITKGVTKIVDIFCDSKESTVKLNATTVNANERKEVYERRKRYPASAGRVDDAVGLALSGGGIRSATFGLGIVQVLADRELLGDVDFLSTVSGGGYTGSFITSRLGSGEPASEIGGSRGPDPRSIKHLRHYARYLMADNLADQWKMVTESLIGMILNWSAPVSLLIWCALALYFVDAPENFWLLGATIAGVTAVLGTLFYGLLVRYPAGAKWGGEALSLLLASVLLFASAWLVHFGYLQLFEDETSWTLSGWSGWSPISAFAAAIAVAGPTIMRFVPIFKNTAIRKLIFKGLLLAAGLVVPLFGLLLFYVFVFTAGLGTGLDAMNLGGRDFPLGSVILGSIAAILLLISFFLFNINLTSPHRLYRDRLARTFIWGGGRDTLLEFTKTNKTHLAPYHLVNCALNLPASESPSMRDRKSDFFLFSKYATGSVMTGYFETGKWKTNHTEVDLATAMAISGAAASSHMGLGSVSNLTALMTVLNVRMGFWILRPDALGIAKLSGLDSPGFTCLLREMTGVQMSEKAAWLNLSDGGHIENIAVYELLRRRCKFIICVDGEADPSFTFHGLMTLVRHAQLDFGIEIKPRLSEIRPDPATGLSRAHGTLCLVRYPAVGGVAEATGLLLYLKLSVTGNESELIQRYRTLHPEFPHQATLDQFFDQEQFEAYRQLGVHVANGFFLPALMCGRADPTTIREWFERLAANLCEPGCI